MKKLLFSTFALALAFAASAQPATDLVKKADKARKAFESDEKQADKAKEALATIEEALKTPEAQALSSAWYSKGKIYLAMAATDFKGAQTAQVLGKKYELKYPAAPMQAFEPLKTAFEKAVKKGEKNDALAGVAEAQGYCNASGSHYYDKQDFVGSFKAFKASLDMHSFLKANKYKSALDKEPEYKNQLFLSAVTAVQGAKEKEATAIFEERIKMKWDTSFDYASLYAIYGETDKAKALKILEEGRAKFPLDNQLMISELNYYIKDGKLEALIEKLKMALDKDPKNVSIAFSLANTYDQLSQKEADATKKKGYEEEAMKAYNMVLEMDSKNVDAIYSIGAGFYNKAAILTKELQEIGKLPLTKENDRKYAEKEKEVAAMFERALPYFQKAESINPNDQNTLIALREIFARKNDLEKSKEFKKRLETVQGGGKNASSFFKQ
jgi:hypothetical protein